MGNAVDKIKDGISLLVTHYHCYQFCEDRLRQVPALRFGGWALYVKDGVPAYDYNFLGLQRSSIASKEKLAPGAATIRFELAYDGGMGKGGQGTLFVNGKKVADGRIEHTQCCIFSADETADVGIDLGTPVVEAIGSEAKSKFTGHIPKVTVEVKEMSATDKTKAERARVELAHKKAISD